MLLYSINIINLLFLDCKDLSGIITPIIRVDSLLPQKSEAQTVEKCNYTCKIFDLLITSNFGKCYYIYQYYRSSILNLSRYIWYNYSDDEGRYYTTSKFRGSNRAKCNSICKIFEFLIISNLYKCYRSLTILLIFYSYTVMIISYNQSNNESQ